MTITATGSGLVIPEVVLLHVPKNPKRSGREEILTLAVCVEKESCGYERGPKELDLESFPRRGEMSQRHRKTFADMLEASSPKADSYMFAFWENSKPGNIREVLIDERAIELTGRTRRRLEAREYNGDMDCIEGYLILSEGVDEEMTERFLRDKEILERHSISCYGASFGDLQRFL